jgi:antirestriction protein ArdC
MRIDVYQKITDQIVLELEKGVMQRNLHDWKRMGLG